MSVRNPHSQMNGSVNLTQESRSDEECVAFREWDEVMAESWSRLQCCRVVIDELSRHPASAAGDLVSYELALSSVYVAIVALEACEQRGFATRPASLNPRTHGPFTRRCP
jgi:hypothetical protein